MRKTLFTVAALASGLFLSSQALADVTEVDESAITTPEEALQALKDGNQRFLSGNTLNQDWKAQIDKTAGGQAPYATVLSCLDSRVPPEILFDQGIGDIFVGRVAGNVESINMLGSFEFAKGVKGTKLLVVLGHTACGAVGGACQDVKLGTLTQLLAEIKPAVDIVQARHPNENVCEMPHVDEISEENVLRTVQDIREKSPIISELEAEGKLKVVGAMYDIKTGEVTWL